MEVTVSGTVNDASLVDSNALRSIVVTELGMLAEVNEVHPLKAYWPIVVKVVGSVISVRAVHP